MLINKRKVICLLAITFLLKFGLAFYSTRLLFSNYPEIQLGVIAVDSGDTFSYLGAIDNLIQTGEYFFWISPEKKVYAGRMPHYGAIYFVLRQFFDQAVAYDAYVLLQIFADSLATVVFALLCFEIFRKRSAFWVGFTVHLCSLNFILFSVQLWTESLSLSFAVFFAYFSHRFWAEAEWKNALWAAVFLALITSLKPYFVLIYPIFLISVFINLDKNQKALVRRQVLVTVGRTALLGLPLALLLAPWVARNLVVLDRFIPTQQDFYAGYDYSRAHLAFVEFVSSWGASSVPWDANDAGCYFLLVKGKTCDYVLPERALTNGYSREEVERVRSEFLNLQVNYSPEVDSKVAAEFLNLSRIYRLEQPFNYHIGARLFYFEKLFFVSYRYRFPFFKHSEHYWMLQSLFGFTQVAIRFVLLFIGALGLIHLALRARISFIFIFIPLLISISFVELRTTERRYVEPVYVFLLIGIVGVMGSFGQIFKGQWGKYFPADIKSETN